MTDTMSFPFRRDETYAFGELRAFERRLLSARQSDAALRASIRCNEISWAKMRNEELLPVLLVADAKGLLDTDTFLLTRPGDANDACIFSSAGTVALQITVADPSWEASANGTYLHYLRMEALRGGQPAFGGKNVTRVNGEVISAPHARHVHDDVAACRSSLARAIRRKQSHDGSGTTLLIYVRGYRFLLIDFDAADLISGAIAEAGGHTFERVCVADEGFYWESD